MKEKKTDWITILLTFVSLILLTYVLIYIINYYNHNGILKHYPNEYNFDNKLLTPNEIGDSIGGILNPIIGFTAAILTFLAFYIQFKANQDQKTIYFENLKRENNYRESEHKVNLRIFKNLVKSMIDHFYSTGKKLPKFIEDERNSPLAMNVLKFTTDNSYEIFKELDFKEIYASVIYNFRNNKTEWEQDFTEVLRILDFYDKLTDEIKKIYNKHIDKKFAAINDIGEKLNLFMNDVFPDEDLKDVEGLSEYMAIVYNRTPDNKPIVPDEEFGFPDIDKLYSDFFPKFLKSLYFNFQNSSNKEKFKKQLDLFNHENKKLGAERSQAIYYSDDLEKNYVQYFQNEENFLKVLSFLNKINCS